MSETTTTLLDWLLRRYPAAKRETLRQMLRDGRVTVNGVAARSLKAPLPPDARVEVFDRARKFARAKPPAKLPFRIIHEDADLLVVEKPAGLLTSTVPGERRPTLLAAVRAYVVAREPRARVGLIHRLDRDAAGLLVFSKNDLAYQSLKTQFFRHDVERVYLAVTDGVPTPLAGRIESRLEERADGTVYSKRGAHTAGRGERAVTHYEVIESIGRHALVRVRLETGRKHQIRVHLSERGTPIVGDAVYGKDEKRSKDRARAGRADGPGLRLLASRLGIVHPRTGEPVSWELSPPPGFWPVSSSSSA